MNVIAKAYGDQPLNRVAVGARGRVIFVAAVSALRAATNPDEVGVGFPHDCVFFFEPTLFDSLSAAWRAGDIATLNALWNQAEPYAV